MDEMQKKRRGGCAAHACWKARGGGGDARQASQVRGGRRAIGAAILILRRRGEVRENAVVPERSRIAMDASRNAIE